jgi:hypothetical protein
MINVLSASLPGRCVMPTHYHASAAGMSDMLKLAAGQASYPGNHIMKLDKMALTALAMGALFVTLSCCQQQEGPAE